MTDPVDTMFEQAVEALRQGDRARAKELLTGLIRANQRNATYWIWLSAAVDTIKERVYCLETARKIDPGNETAKRGLILFGALPPDENVKPFPLNRPRAWENQLRLANEEPRQSGLQAFAAHPATRLAATVVFGAALISGILLIGLSPRTAAFRPSVLVNTGASPTFSPTPTFVNVGTVQVKTPGVPTPLAVLLGIYYTPTPRYVNTPRAAISADIYRAALAARDRGDWDQYLQEMMRVQEMEPAAADIQYQIAEDYRFNGQCSRALYYYNESLKVDEDFAPSYLGLARARLCSDPGANVLGLYQLAQDHDPGYGETYLDRAVFHLAQKDFADALPDLNQARRLMPDSALVEVALAQAYLLEGDADKGLAAAITANTIDRTLLASYQTLGRAYIANEQYAEAIEPLRIYVLYAPNDAAAYAQLGQALAKTEDYQNAVLALNQALKLDPNQVSAFIYLGTAYLNLNNMGSAEYNFKRGIEFYPDSFDANIGLTEIYYRRGTYGTAYLQAETAISKARSDAQRALALYWRALAHEGRKSWNEALKDWETLLALPDSAMTADMRATAQEHLRTIVTATSPAKGARPSTTSTASATKRPGNTATPPPARTSTPTPTQTRTPASTATP